MKRTKKMASFLMAMMMVLAMSITTMAGVITIAPMEGSGIEYTYYVMMRASVSANGETAYHVTDEALANGLKSLKVEGKALFEVTKVETKANYWNVEFVDPDAVSEADIAAQLATIKNLVPDSDKGAILNNAHTFTEDVFVLVESNVGTKFITETISGDVNVADKNEQTTASLTAAKKVIEIGETVTGSVAISVSNAPQDKDAKVTLDVASQLSVDTGSAITVAETSVTGLNGVKWTDAGVKNGMKKYTITIPANVVDANKGKTITISYAATLDKTATVNTQYELSTCVTVDNYTSKPSAVKVQTCGFDLTRTNENGTKLAGVKYILKNSKGLFYTNADDRAASFAATESELVTDSNGKIAFTGLGQGEYTLTETQTIAGYNLLPKSVKIIVNENGTITFDGASYTGNELTIQTKAGTKIPSTGGIGTTAFYVLGTVLVAGAGAVLITRKRISSK